MWFVFFLIILGTLCVSGRHLCYDQCKDCVAIIMLLLKCILCCMFPGFGHHADLAMLLHRSWKNRFNCCGMCCHFLVAD
jgi:uncharacterized membrane protein